MKKYLIFSLVGLAALALGAGTALAYQGGVASDSSAVSQERPALNRLSSGESAIASGDYDAWQTQMQERITKLRAEADELEALVSEDTFAKLQEAHELMVAGDTEGAQAIYDELGWQNKKGFGGRNHGFPKGDRPDWTEDLSSTEE
jgi:hypothetical protein